MVLQSPNNLSFLARSDGEDLDSADSELNSKRIHGEKLGSESDTRDTTMWGRLLKCLPVYPFWSYAANVDLCCDPQVGQGREYEVTTGLEDTSVRVDNTQRPYPVAAKCGNDFDESYPSDTDAETGASPNAGKVMELTSEALSAFEQTASATHGQNDAKYNGYANSEGGDTVACLDDHIDYPGRGHGQLKIDQVVALLKHIETVTLKMKKLKFKHTQRNIEHSDAPFPIAAHRAVGDKETYGDAATDAATNGDALAENSVSSAGKAGDIRDLEVYAGDLALSEANVKIQLKAMQEQIDIVEMRLQAKILTTTELSTEAINSANALITKLEAELKKLTDSVESDTNMSSTYKRIIDKLIFSRKSMIDQIKKRTNDLNAAQARLNNLDGVDPTFNHASLEAVQTLAFSLQQVVEEQEQDRLGGFQN